MAELREHLLVRHELESRIPEHADAIDKLTAAREGRRAAQIVRPGVHQPGVRA